MTERGFRPEGIGSRIPLEMAALLGPRRREIPWPRDPLAATETGRAAIGWLVEALGMGPGDRALLPAYVCDAAVDAFRVRRVATDFYRVGLDLRPDGTDAAARITQATRVLMVVHYFGYPLDRESLEAMPAGPGLTRLEDWVQGPLSDGAWSGDWFGEYRVLSFHKVVGVPDSGLLVRRPGVSSPGNPESWPPLRAPRAAFFGRRLAAKTLKAIAVRLAGGAPRPLYRPLFDAAEREADGGVLARMSGVSRRILEGLPVREIVARRRDNARRLGESVGRIPGVTRMLADPPEGVCPLGVPIRVARRDAVLGGLVARRVYAAVHWRLPAGVDAAAYPEAARLAAEEITLPVDQRYGADEMDYVARALADAMRDAGEG